MVVGGSLLALFVAGSDLALANSASINNVLHAETFKVVTDSSQTSVDTTYFKADYPDAASLKAYCKAKASAIESEGCVLLKNSNNALPLSNGAKVSLLGQGAVKTNYATSGSSSAAGVTYPSLQETLSAKGLSINQTALDFYQSGAGSQYGRGSVNLIYQINEAPWSAYDDATKTSITTYGDAAIVVFCRDSGEGSDISLQGSDGEDGSYLSISAQEAELLKELNAYKAAGSVKKIIVVLNMAVPMETDFLFRDELGVDACLWAGNLGSFGPYGLADVLVGETTPSGHLCDTFLRDNQSSPALANWLANPKKSLTQRYSNYKTYSIGDTASYYLNYLEGIYVGYRYYETRYEDKVKQRGNAGDFDYSSVVSYPFGYGLSYTDFTYSDFAVTAKDQDTYTASLKVTNSGSTYSGKQVVEIYAQKPYTTYDVKNGVEKSAVDLVGFAKTSLLAPGASETVSVNVAKEEFKSYDANKAKTYIVDEGDYYLAYGNGSHEALNNILALQGVSGTDAAGNAALAQKVYTQASLDATTYAVSKETGAAITNQFDFMDMNKYSNHGDNKVTYLTRHDWTGTWPSTAASFAISGEKMAKDLASNKAIDKGSATMPQYGIQNGLSLISLRSTASAKITYEDSLWDSLLDQMSEGDQALLISNSAFNTPSVPSVNKPATKDNDGPTGLVGTTTGTVMPSEGIWASSFNQALIQDVGDALAEDVRLAGYQSLYAPGVNLHRTPFGGRLNEYFSEDPYLTGISASMIVKGMQAKGVIPTVKHFAFNNEEKNRNGVGVWMNEQEARELNLKPFDMVSRPSQGNAHGIMTSFNRAGCIWASASSELLQNFARKECGFDGYFLTDMASGNGAAYMTYDDGIFNGTDLFLGNGSASSLDAWKDNPAYAQRMREACHRVLYVIANYSCAMNGLSSASHVVAVTPSWQKLLKGLTIGSGVLFGLSAAALACCYFVKKKGD